jgi:hypothetical protein
VTGYRCLLVRTGIGTGIGYPANYCVEFQALGLTMQNYRHFCLYFFLHKNTGTLTHSKHYYIFPSTVSVPWYPITGQSVMVFNRIPDNSDRMFNVSLFRTGQLQMGPGPHPGAE